MELLQDEDVVCHHCGDPCDLSITLDSYFFCCFGCRAVHELLENGQLKDHFEQTSVENKSLSQIKAERKYSFLENEDVQLQLIGFRNDTRSVIRFFLPGIHCSSCIYLLEHLPRLDNNILRSEVNFVRKELSITFLHNNRSLKEIAILLSQLGYPPDISLSDLDKTSKRVVKSDIGTKIAVAGFCFGNAMLMSMPEYLDRNLQLTSDFKQLFGWINLILALPIILYSGRDYFTRAWSGIRHKNLNIDVPIALGILTLFGRSAFEIAIQIGGGYVDSLAGLVFFLLIGKWYQGKSYQALTFDRDYTSYFPVSVSCLVGDEEVRRQLKDLKKGDVLLIHNDELIPADGRIIKGEGTIDYSFVTGESKPDRRSAGQQVYAGGRQKGPELTIELNKSVDNSELTQLWNSNAFRKPNGLHTWIDKISQYFTLIIIAIAVGTGCYWWFMDARLVWNAVTAVLIVACPCALALTLPFAYGHAMRILGKHGLYLKNAEIIEPIGKIDTIVFDKTGTLTTSESGLTFIGEPLSKKQMQLLSSALSNSAHPLSRLIRTHLPETEKMPLTYFREETGKGFKAEIMGHLVSVGSSEMMDLTPNPNVNETQVHVSVDDYLGYFVIKSTYREGSFDMLKNLNGKYSTMLLSGDRDSERDKLARYFDEVYFNQKPMDKLHFLKGVGSNSLMIGDGLNDAGALKKADVGIAVSEDVYQFSPACDAILSASSINKIPAVLTFARSVRTIVFVAFAISFLYNIVGLSFAVSGHLTPLVSAILMPISSVTVVGFVTLMIQKIERKLILT